MILLLCALLAQEDERLHTTFSIVCRDPATGEFGVGVTTMPTQVRRWCPFARAGVGAVCTQAMTNRSYGEKGLDLLAAGKTPAQAVKELTDADDQSAQRQVGIIDGKNPPAAFTGRGCQKWCGQILRKDCAVQGNLLVSEKTLQECARAFEETPGSLAGRILAALAAGKAAGGDKRGHRSCAVIVASKKTLDLYVDDDPEPVEAVRKQFLAEGAEWFRLGDRELGKGDEGADVAELRRLLGEKEGAFDEGLEAALKAWQKKKGHKETGRADAATVKALLKAK